MIASFCVTLKICFQKVGKEKDFQNYKHDKELDQND